VAGRSSLPIFLEAVVLGVVVAAPLGPVGATVVRTGLLRGFAPALAIGVGAGVVDGVYFVAASVLILAFAVRFLVQGLGEYVV
jgi:threonine/homoserine/homoserine lactone efflux protein